MGRNIADILKNGNSIEKGPATGADPDLAKRVIVIAVHAG
jgi:hypothetical protein